MRIAIPRVLPVTILALAALLGMKTVGLVRAVAPALAASAPGGTAPGSTASGGTASGGALGDSAPAAIGAPAAIRAAAEPSARPAPAISPAEQALLTDLRRRSRALDARARALDARDSLLAAAERRLDQRVAELKALQGKLEALDAARRQRSNDAWDGLVKLYQTMKPRQAATIFDKLSMPVLLAVVDRMDARHAAAILAAMQPERAREVTDRLAALRLGRDALPAPTTAAPPPGPPGAGG
jgi:flagellar motility protein MotE (MotC chaperone)